MPLARLTLAASLAAALAHASPTGKLSVTADPWGSVKIDGEVVASETPLLGYRLAPGKHQVEVCTAGDLRRCSLPKEVEIEAGRGATLRFDGASLASSDRPTVVPPEIGALSYDDKLKLALKAVAMGDREGAVRVLLDAAAEHPEDPKPHRRLCAVLPPMGRLKEGLHRCRLWLATEPNAAYRAQIRRRIETLKTELSEAGAAEERR